MVIDAATLLGDSRPLIGAERFQSSAPEKRPHINPATGQAQAELTIAGPGEIDRAVKIAGEAQRVWMAFDPGQRRDVLLKFADLVEAEADRLNYMAALEGGTPLAVGGGVPLALRWIRYYAGWADKIEGTIVDAIGAPGHALIRPEPMGVIGVIIPWNSPVVATAMSAVLALAGGNAVVLKPPTQTPFVALRLGELALAAGLPAGALAVVPGDAAAGEALVAHPGIAKVSFTGGTAVARAVMRIAAEHLKPVALELGGKSANIVFGDADLDAAARMAAVAGLMALSGQGCVLPTRVYAERRIEAELVERIRAHAESFRMGDPLDPATTLGPVINEAAADRIVGVIERALRDCGGRLVTGGSRAGGALAGGYFIEPTIFAGVDHDSHLAREEVFGPVLAICSFDSEDEVVRKANDSHFGLGAYLHTNDLKRAHRLTSSLQAGAVAVNGMLPMSPNMPFGGIKQSGFGREGGRPGLEEFMHLKTVFYAH